MSNFSKQHFGDIDIKELIQHYKQYDCLWNFNSPDYKNKSSKQEAWVEIANHFQKDVNEVKRKVKYLRTAYVAEKKKVEASRKSGNTPYKPSLFYYKDLNFLEDVVVWRKFGNETEHNELEFISADAVGDEELFSYVNQEEEGVDLKQPPINCKTETYIDPEPEPSPPPQIRSTPKISYPRSLASRALKRKISPAETKVNRSSSSIVATLPTVNNSKCKSLYISFGKTISLQLQQLPLDVAIATMSEIHTLLTKKTLEHIRSTSLQNGNHHDSYTQSESDDSYSELIEEALNDSS